MIHKHGSYELTQDRKDAIKEMSFPCSHSII
jgi:hypothetical protein